MKSGLLLLFTCFIFSAGFSTRITAIANQGTGWNVASNWDLNRIPKNNDTVVIPNGLQMNVKGAVYGAPYPNIDLFISGVLYFEPSGKLDLGIESSILVDATGSINSTGSSSELIRINGVVKYNGSADGLLVGPATADQYTLASPSGFMFAILTTRFESFIGTPEGWKVKLHFKVSNDINIDRIEIEKSTDGKQWNKVTEKLLHSKNAEGNLYDPSGLTDASVYYRLLVFESNALVSISKVIAVQTARQSNLFLVKYNQQTGNLHIKCTRKAGNHLSMHLISDAGQLIKTEPLNSQTNTWTLHVVPPKHGLYFIVIEDEHHVSASHKLFL